MFLAHISEDKLREQSILDHLEQVNLPLHLDLKLGDMAAA